MASEHSRRLAQIALMWRGNLGPMGFRRLVAHFGGPETALQAPAEELSLPSLRLEPVQVAAITGPGQDLEGVEQELEEIARQNISVLCDFELEYPRVLIEMRDSPPVLCIAGRRLAVDEPAVALVGTRQPTREGRERATRLAQALAQEGITVVSGLARGCDTAAHRGALSSGGRTLAVLGSGITIISPRQNLELARRIATSGAVFSELPPNAMPSTARLLARNRLQVGLSQAVIVVQAGSSGGGMRTAERAFKMNRLVYVVVWPAGEEKAGGNYRLLDEGARALGEVKDIPNLVRELYVHQERSRREQAVAKTQMRLFPPNDK